MDVNSIKEPQSRLRKWTTVDSISANTSLDQNSSKHGAISSGFRLEESPFVPYDFMNSSASPASPPASAGDGWPRAKSPSGSSSANWPPGEAPAVAVVTRRGPRPWAGRAGEAGAAASRAFPPSALRGAHGGPCGSLPPRSLLEVHAASRLLAVRCPRDLSQAP